MPPGDPTSARARARERLSVTFEEPFNEQKGLGVLLAALAEVAKHVPDVEL